MLDLLQNSNKNNSNNNKEGDHYILAVQNGSSDVWVDFQRSHFRANLKIRFIEQMRCWGFFSYFVWENTRNNCVNKSVG